MPLQGTFDVLDFSEILRLLGRRGVTGRLHLRSRAMTANIFFEEGALVGADQSEHQPAAATGDVRSRLEEVCFELLEADRGTFEFQPGKATSIPGAARLKVETVLSRARTRLDEWRLLTERVPSTARTSSESKSCSSSCMLQAKAVASDVHHSRNWTIAGRTLAGTAVS